MLTRKEIEKYHPRRGAYPDTNDLILEVLLDIRDLLDNWDGTAGEVEN